MGFELPIISFMAKHIREGLARTLSVKYVDHLVLLLAKTNDEFAYAIQKVHDIDPLNPESILCWLVKWGERNAESMEDSFKNIFAELKKKGYLLEKTSGYLVIYGPKFPRQVYSDEDRTLFFMLGFQCRSRPDKARENRAKWWKVRNDYSPPLEKEGLSDYQIQARYGRNYV